MPSVAESTCPAITVEPNASPACALPSHQPTCWTFSGTLRNPSTVAAGWTAALASSGECEAFWNEFDPLTGGRTTLARRGDRRSDHQAHRRGARHARRRLRGAAAEKRKQAKHTHEERRSPGRAAEAPEPGLQGSSRQRARFTCNDGPLPTA